MIQEMTEDGTRKVHLDHGVVQVDTQGSGPEVLVIHSLLTGPEAFDQVADSLAGTVTVHRVHLPGYGVSSPLASPDVSIADLADLIASVMSAMEMGRETTVLGNGLGSFVALSLAIGHGDTFGGLIVANTGAGFPDDRRGAFVTMSDLARDGGMSAVADVAIARIFPPGYADEHPDAFEERRAVLEKVDPNAFASASRALSVLDLSEDLGRITNQTLVIVGDIDQTTPPEMGRAVANAIPGARLETIHGSGHCPQLEQPAALTNLIAGFVAEMS